ncbi:MAG: hypothetical protein LWW74_03430, partial [Burkholderiales bacterium]|nr:hypothetical protein [Burkholderiales bacterium]
MSEVKKKSYSKKPSKKERLAAELAQKEQKARAQSIVTAGGVVIRADGVAMSSVALAARQKALQMAQAQDTQNTRDSDTAKSSRTRGKAKTDASASVPKIEASQDSGKRLAQCLWCAQILLMDVLKFDAAADKQVSMFLRAHKELGARDRHIVAETVYAVLRHRRVLAHLAQTGMGALERRLVLLAAQKVVDMNSLQAAIPEEEFAWVTETLKAPIHDLPAAVRSNLPDEWFAALVGAYGEDETLKLTEALNQSAPLDIRVNTIKSSREAVQIAFEHAGIESAVCA